MAPDRCLDCHTALRGRIAARQGLHARAGHQKCETCHNEHHGREFELVYWGKQGTANFDHRTAGWALEGAHARAACRSCHRPERLRNGPALKSGRANPSRTFLGLSPACVSCHRDEHRGQLSNAGNKRGCLSCHSMAGWRPAPKFDHARAPFALTGRHQEVACASCHPARTDTLASDPDRRFQLFRGIAHGSCANCHKKDPHQGRFGPSCQTCHSTAGWKEGARARFDHSRTGFPLTGQHRAVACASCHKTRDSSGQTTFARMAHSRCSDCHRDPHAGRMGANCGSCHSTSGWKGAGSVANVDHDRTRFPLRGLHRKVACQSCHTPGRPMRMGKLSCAECHQDAHAGQLANRSDEKRPGGISCERCHSVEGFSPSKFTLAEHQKGPFPLKGAHLAVPCIACHKAQEKRGARLIPLRFASTRCQACHGDPHHGEVERFAAQGGCETCHAVETWRKVIFDHDRTRFPLEGGHQGVACRSCHPTVDKGKPRERLRMKGTPTACASCHGDPHEGQFAQLASANTCQQCHSVLAWNRIAFDHDRHSRFKLEGAHRAVACASCHKREVRNGKPFVRFKPLPVTCEGCHSGGQMNGRG